MIYTLEIVHVDVINQNYFYEIFNLKKNKFRNLFRVRV